jgi:biopolymer transport protein ExbD
MNRFTQRRKRSELRLEVIPIIDVMFTLLIFFVIFSSTLATLSHKGMPMNLPSASSVTTEKKTVLFSIDHDFHFYLDDNQIPQESLRKKIAEMVRENPTVRIMLSADKEVPYDLVIRALDDVRLGGCYDIVLRAKQKGTHVPN